LRVECEFHSDRNIARYCTCIRGRDSELWHCGGVGTKVRCEEVHVCLELQRGESRDRSEGDIGLDVCGLGSSVVDWLGDAIWSFLCLLDGGACHLCGGSGWLDKCSHNHAIRRWIREGEFDKTTGDFVLPVECCTRVVPVRLTSAEGVVGIVDRVEVVDEFGSEDTRGASADKCGFAVDEFLEHSFGEGVCTSVGAESAGDSGWLPSRNASFLVRLSDCSLRLGLSCWLSLGCSFVRHFTGTDLNILLKMSKSRGYVFTLNNYTNEEYESLRDWKQVHYLIAGKEVGEQGTPHIQGYVLWDNARHFTAMQKLLPRAHWEKAKASALANYNYSTKEGGEFLEIGDRPSQGARTDLAEVRDRIEGGLRVDALAMENPVLVHQYGRTLDRIEDIVMRRVFRTEMTEAVWIWGPTNTGKSHAAFEGFTPETHYLWPNDGKWWDGYRQQETVIFNDFRGEIPYNVMLQIVDKWPFQVPRRGREPMPFTSKRVIVTSSLSPMDVYHNRAAEDLLAQLLRRFDVQKLARDFGT